MKAYKFILFLFISLIPFSLSSKPMVADLALRSIDIDTKFNGLEILLFGARNDAGDVVVVVRGPKKSYEVLKKEKVFGMWVNRKKEFIGDAYSFYSIATSKPLFNISNSYMLKALGIGKGGTSFFTEKAIRFSEPSEFTAAFFESKQKKGLYPKEEEKISFWGETLFRTTLSFPENIPAGTYAADIYLVNGNQIASMQTTPIYVDKVGFEAFLHNLAYNHEIIYGFLSVLIALFAGWIASVIFQKT